MSKPREPSLTKVKVEAINKAPALTRIKVERKNGTMSSGRESEFVYVNSAFVGSINNVNTVNTVNTVNPVIENRRTNRTPAAPAAPITEVYREQYWACSRWPYTQRVLAIAVGVLLGALIGLLVSFLLKDKEDSLIFTRQHVVPD